MRPKALFFFLKSKGKGEEEFGRLLRQISFRTVHILAPTDLVEREDHMLKGLQSSYEKTMKSSLKSP